MSDRPTFSAAFESASSGTESVGTPSQLPADSAPQSSSVGASQASHSADASQPAVAPTAQLADAAPESEPVGPIPLERHKAILENARRKAREEAEAAFQQQYGWAAGAAPEEIQARLGFYEQYAADPVQFLSELAQYLGQTPEYAQALRSRAASILAQRQASADPEPEPDIPLDDGRALYSAEQLRKRDEWLRRQLKAEVQATLKPIQDTHEQQALREQALQYDRQIREWSRSTLERLRQLPHFKEHEAEIAQEFSRLTYGGQVEDGHAAVAIRDAYLNVLRTRVLPSLTTRTQVINDLNTKARAGTQPPSAASATRPDQRPKTFEEAFAQQATRR